MKSNNIPPIVQKRTMMQPDEVYPIKLSGIQIMHILNSLQDLPAKICKPIEQSIEKQVIECINAKEKLIKK